MTPLPTEESLKNEIWGRISGYPDYEVSNLGRILSFRANKENPKIMRQCKGRKGYLRVCLINENGHKMMIVSRLVAAAFIGEIPIGFIVDHIDGNIKNNTACNLRHLTNTENVLIGNGPPAKNKRKTHCIRGHLFVESSIFNKEKGWRRCNVCVKILEKNPEISTNKKSRPSRSIGAKE